MRISRADIAELIGEIIIANGADFGHDDLVAVHTDTIGDAMLTRFDELGLAVTRKRVRNRAS